MFDQEEWVRLNCLLLVCEIESHLIARAYGIRSIYDEDIVIKEPSKAEITWM